MLSKRPKYGLPQLIFSFCLGVLFSPFSGGFLFFFAYIIVSGLYFVIFKKVDFIIQAGAFFASLSGYIVGRTLILSSDNDDPFNEKIVHLQEKVDDLLQGK